MFHIRAARPDLCFELATQILARLRGAVTPVDEAQGFLMSAPLAPSSCEKLLR